MMCTLMRRDEVKDAKMDLPEQWVVFSGGGSHSPPLESKLDAYSGLGFRPSPTTYPFGTATSWSGGPNQAPATRMGLSSGQLCPMSTTYSPRCANLCSIFACRPILSALIFPANFYDAKFPYRYQQVNSCRCSWRQLFISPSRRRGENAQRSVDSTLSFNLTVASLNLHHFIHCGYVLHFSGQSQDHAPTSDGPRNPKPCPVPSSSRY